MSVIVGGLFECKPLRAKLSVKQCESNWRQANDHATKLRYAKFQKSRIARRECVGCEIGRAHAESGERATGVDEASVVAAVSAPEPKKAKKRVELPVVRQELPKPPRVERVLPSPGRMDIEEDTSEDIDDEESLEATEIVEEVRDTPEDIDLALVDDDLDDGVSFKAGEVLEDEPPPMLEPPPVGEVEPATRRTVVERPKRTDHQENVCHLPPAEVARLESACRQASEAYRRMMKSGGRPLAASRYAPEVRDMALKLYRHYGQVLAVAQRTGISASSLSWWVKRVDYERRRGEKFNDWAAREQELLAERGETAVLPPNVVVTAAGVSVVESVEPEAPKPAETRGAAVLDHIGRMASAAQDPVARAKSLLAEREVIAVALMAERKRLVERLAEVDSVLKAMGVESS